LNTAESSKVCEKSPLGFSRFHWTLVFQYILRRGKRQKSS